MAPAPKPDRDAHRQARDAAIPGGEQIAPGVRVPAAVLRFSFARSSGPGGQNVNKVSTKAELRVSVDDLPLPARVRARLRRLAASRFVGGEVVADETGREHLTGGEVVLVCDEHRSQSRNKSECLDRLRELIVAAMAEPKIRRATRPTRGSTERRIAEKKSRGEIKRGRARGGES
ncbi:MAG: aminoacyl-tRNA hydrolase [Phycisphaeraceae bacterium]|nr:aminoacyl-tRNA hydrolase [Phycisphaeraceae bacterium]